MGAVRGMVPPSQRRFAAVATIGRDGGWHGRAGVLWALAMRIATLSIALAAPLLAGCSTVAADRYPSLAQREGERAQGQFAPGEVKTLAVPPVDTGSTAPLPERLAALVAQAERGHSAFRAAQADATRLAEAAAGAAVASDGWASAQVALAGLDSARSETAIPLGDLDILHAAASLDASADSAAIAAARDRVIALVAEEDAVLEQLRARLR